MSDAILAKWTVFIFGIMSAVMGVAGYAFQHFETIEHAQEMRSGIERRLDRLEGKIDVLIDRK